MKILIFGGTAEGRILAEKLCAQKHAVTVSVATEVGAEALHHIFGLNILQGRKTKEEIQQILTDYELCIDATHPYSKEISENIRLACANTGVRKIRLVRSAAPVDNCQCFSSCAEAASYLSGREGNVLIATGSKELAEYAVLEPERLYPRVLPTHEGISACEAAGIPHRNILALQGPFTRKMNEAMLEQYSIRYMVTRESGQPGGTEEKLAAAAATGVEVLLICRPKENGESIDTILQLLEGEQK